MEKTVLIIAVNEHNECLVLKRADHKSWYPGMWSIISGKLNQDESVNNCVKRELFEETGIEQFNIIESGDTHVYEESGKKWLVHPFLLRVKKQDIKLNKEHKDFKWVNIDEFLNLDLPKPVNKVIASFSCFFS